jgi:two-component system, NtrC family, nitrogen regulation sensor histidine kinase NtrY
VLLPITLSSFLIILTIIYLIKYLTKYLYLFLKVNNLFINESENAYCIVYDDYSIKYANKNFIKINGLENDKIIQKSILSLNLNVPIKLDLFKKARKSNSSAQEKIFYKNEDYELNGILSIQPLKIFNSKIIAYLIEIKNYTRPILEERLEIWGKSIQKIAHDIKTPLSIIALNLKAIQIKLENQGLSNEGITDDINTAKNEIDRIKNLTKDFLKFVDLNNPSFQAIRHDEIIKTAIKKFKELFNEKLVIEYNNSVENKSIWADPRQIELVFNIMIENAIDALGDKGLISIETELVQDLKQIEKEMIQISITDNGAGIKSDLMPKVFEPHFSTKVDGTGMGLAFAKKIINEHKGNIEVHSKEKMGTTFKITLPLFDE